MTELAIPSRTTEHKPWELRYLWPLLAGMLVLRIVFDMRFALVEDEAVYWSWSRHLALGYFDHPPMIAWINWVSCRLLGATELGVRLPCTLMAVTTVAVIVVTAHRAIRNTQAVRWVAIMWLVSPLLMGIATISTPDTPAIFFSTCALAFAVQIATNDDQKASPPSEAGRWIAFGAFCGLALLSKYTTVLLPGSVIFSLLLSRAGRRHLRQPWMYLSALIALLIFSPVIWWNEHHHWSSFLFQLHHGLSDEPVEAPVSVLIRILLVGRNLVVYLAGQALLWTPVLFAIGAVVLFGAARRTLHLSEVDRLLMLSAAFPLALFAVASAHKLGEVNWPSFAYVPLSLLTGRWIAEKDTASRGHAVKEGCKLALVVTVVMQLLFIPGIPRLLALTHLPLPHSVRDLLVSDRRDYGRELALAANGAMIVCNRHQEAAEAAFYMPGQPEVWCDGVGSRPTAYDYFDVKPDFQTIDRVLFVGGHVKMFMSDHGYTQMHMVTIAPPQTPHNRIAFMVTR